uniref:C-mannosyltransferase DPY19L3 n=1 Tax=Romanomermis culicivorax TaxID=13658 RepID=A0A915J3X9_ROMCU
MESDKIHLKKRRKRTLKSNDHDLGVKGMSLEHEKRSTSTKARTACVPQSSYFSELLETLKWLWIALGVAVLGYSGYWFAWYIQTLHENQMWFTNIRQVEREISLRTECGLYYSYYKQLVNSSTFIQGFRDLQNDNVTENARTINILKRFNIYQEVFLAWLYRILPQKWQNEPILFYVYSIFKLNGFYVSVLFALTWFMCGDGVNWLPGLLSAVFFTVNLTDSTRVYFTINLRECFGFPILWCQILFICIYMKCEGLDERRQKSYDFAKDVVLSLAILISTFLFALTWQFNQFIMLLQSGSIYAIGLLHLIPEWKVRRLLLLELSALLLACLTQFGQPMLLGSLLVAFVPGAVLSLCICRQWTISGGVVNGSLKLVIQACFTLILTFFVHFCFKKMLQLDADDHIFKFLKGKFGFADPRDFESRIYLCHGAFFFLENDFYLRTSNTLVFPLYVLMLCGCLVILGKDIMFEWCSLTSSKTKYASPDTADITDKIFYFNRRPELAYLLIQSIASGFLAMMALRMKYLWTPHLCVLAAMSLGDSDIWTTLIAKFRVKSAKLWSFLLTSTLCTALSMGLIFNYKPVYE